MPRNRRPHKPQPCLRDLARLFLAEKRVERDLKPSTLAIYSRSLDMFLGTPGLPEYPADLSKAHALEWTATLRERGLAPGGINSYQRPVWTWFRWLYANDYCPEDIPRKVSRVPVRDPRRRTATPEVYRAMVGVASRSIDHPLRDVALIEVLWSTGARRTELTMLDFDDFDPDEATLRFRHTKTGLARLSGVGDVARLALDRYIVRERGLEPGPLFLDRFKGRLSSNAVRCMLRKVAGRAGVTATSHDFRRAAAANMLGAWMDPADVARQLGHSRVEQTLVYAEASRTARALRAFHRIDREMRRAERSAG